MTKLITSISLILLISSISKAQSPIPFDTTLWNIQANAYVIENYKGEDAIYIQRGMAVLKDSTFLNGTLEFDIYLTERRSFPGIRFRASDANNMESFYFRPHLSGQPDANQATPVINGLSAWQLYFGAEFSCAYDYQLDAWTHVKLVVNNRRAQLYLDHAKTPQLSWNLKHHPQAGPVALGGSMGAVHYANFKMDKSQSKIVDFKVNQRERVENIIAEWEISDAFKEEELDELQGLPALIDKREWGKKIQVEENNVANISRVSARPSPAGNTVFARIRISSNRDQTKLFHFGYSDRVVAVLNGKAIYKGSNQFRSRDYRYLGTVGLFDGIYLDLKQGENILLLAVSESFGGWGVTGKFENTENIEVR